METCHRGSAKLPSVLVVIDMQTGFNASADRKTQQGVLRLVEQAVAAEQAVLIVEFVLGEPNVCGKTHRALLEPLLRDGGYAKWEIVSKADVDGSAEISASLQRLGIAAADLTVCGICTHGCVQQTVEGLSERLPESIITVVKNACHQDLTGNDWARFPCRANVQLSET